MPNPAGAFSRGSCALPQPGTPAAGQGRSHTTQRGSLRHSPGLCGPAPTPVPAHSRGRARLSPGRCPRGRPPTADLIPTGLRTVNKHTPLKPAAPHPHGTSQTPPPSSQALNFLAFPRNSGNPTKPLPGPPALHPSVEAQEGPRCSRTHRPRGAALRPRDVPSALRRESPGGAGITWRRRGQPTALLRAPSLPPPPSPPAIPQSSPPSPFLHSPSFLP